jgi:hypothetical protein
MMRWREGTRAVDRIRSSSRTEQLSPIQRHVSGRRAAARAEHASRDRSCEANQPSVITATPVVPTKANASAHAAHQPNAAVSHTGRAATNTATTTRTAASTRYPGRAARRPQAGHRPGGANALAGQPKRGGPAQRSPLRRHGWPVATEVERDPRAQDRAMNIPLATIRMVLAVLGGGLAAEDFSRAPTAGHDLFPSQQVVCQLVIWPPTAPGGGGPVAGRASHAPQQMFSCREDSHTLVYALAAAGCVEEWSRMITGQPPGRPPIGSLADRLDWLFDKIRPGADELGRGEQPGRQYTNREIADKVNRGRRLPDGGMEANPFGVTISAAYVGELRRGVTTDPRVSHARALAWAFELADTRYLIDDSVSQQVQGEIDFLLELRAAGVQEVALRTVLRGSGLAEESVQIVEQLVAHLRRRRTPDEVGQGPPP